MPRKSKFNLGEASKKVSKTGARVQAPPCNCDRGAPPLSPNWPLPLTTKQTPTDFSMPEKVCDLFNLAYHRHSLISPNCPTRQEVDYTREEGWGSAGPEAFTAHIATSEPRKPSFTRKLWNEENSPPNLTLPSGQPNKTTLSWAQGSKKVSMHLTAQHHLPVDWSVMQTKWGPWLSRWFKMT